MKLRNQHHTYENFSSMHFSIVLMVTAASAASQPKYQTNLIRIDGLELEPPMNWVPTRAFQKRQVFNYLKFNGMKTQTPKCHAPSDNGLCDRCGGKSSLLCRCLPTYVARSRLIPS
jgi:hypothetical protein